MMHAMGVNTVSGLIHQAFQYILSNYDCFIKGGSGWVLKRIVSLDIQLIKIVKALRGGCRDGTALPRKLISKKCILNIKSPRGECFAYAIAACLKRKDVRCLNFYKQMVSQFTACDNFMPISKIPNFEIKNNVQIYFFKYTNNQLFSLYNSNRSHGKRCNLLLFKKHYYPITN